MLHIKATKAEIRGDVTFFLDHSRNMVMAAQDVSGIFQRMTKLELWLILREVRDSRVSNEELQEFFGKFDVKVWDRGG